MKQFLLILTFLSTARWGWTQEIDFNRQIRPLLSDNCFKCHGPDESKRKAKLRLDTEAGLRAELDDHKLIVPGKPMESELYRRIAHEDEDERMPPAKSRLKLSAAGIELVRKWIAQGAGWQEHWSLRPLAHPQPPAVEESGWPINPIDQFILRRLQKEGLSPSPDEEKTRILRRLSFDLTGLPPELEEIDSFLAAKEPDAYGKVVERLLEAPSYGERMAWDWLDLARYADTNGFQGDGSRTMWPWRDWVVRALNDNMPYDRFTIEQLAGDMLPEATMEQKLATGFCRNHMINGEGGRIAEENRVEYVFDQIETVGTVWMGLTVQCARCHDHKFDPLKQRDYYQLFALFNQTPVNGGGGDPATAPAIRAPDSLQYGKLEELKRGITASAAEVAKLEDGVFSRDEGKDAAQSESAKGLPKKVIEALSRSPGKRNPAQLSELEKHYKESSAGYAALLKKLREQVSGRQKLEKSFVKVMVMQDRPNSRKTFILYKGLYNQKREEVSAEVPQSLPALAEKAPRNRLSLARWLVDPSHPLTARVTVNREWQKFFGTGLVKTVEDFGSQGEKPSHPELLDWLATEFIRSGWDLKALHRLIVTSATYRQSARLNDQLSGKDPANRLLGRGPRRRMPSWMIRDHALAASGLLARRLGGPSVRPYQPKGIWAEATFGKMRYRQDKGENLYRRSLYTFWRRIIGPTIFFDEAKRQTCEVRKTLTNTPLHALATLNGITYVEAARVLAQRVIEKAGPEAGDRIQMAFRLATSRIPSAGELEILLRRLEILKRQYSTKEEEARKLLAVGDSPRNEKLDAIEHAAYAGLCSLVLNLDEALTK